MIVRFSAQPPLARMASVPLPVARRSKVMKWETPQAIDYRFGMEITMYIANR
jgi:coenzyme PQQ precursor peptide PqqA